MNANSTTSARPSSPAAFTDGHCSRSPPTCTGRTGDDVVRSSWAGEDIDLSGPLPSVLILAAAQVDPSIGRGIGPYLAMEAGPDSLAAVEPLARAVYAAGWRPGPDPGPSRRELVELVRGATGG